MAQSIPAGLCDSCRHQRVVTSGRGSAFSLCELSRVDARFPRYPPLPVLACDGYETRDRPGDAGPETEPPAVTGAGP